MSNYEHHTIALPSKELRDLGSCLDPRLSMHPQATSTVRAGYIQDRRPRNLNAFVRERPAPTPCMILIWILATTYVLEATVAALSAPRERGLDKSTGSGSHAVCIKILSICSGWGSQVSLCNRKFVFCAQYRAYRPAYLLFTSTHNFLHVREKVSMTQSSLLVSILIRPTCRQCLIGLFIGCLTLSNYSY